MKRYLVFSFQVDDHATSGGWDDFVKDFEDIDEAKEVANKEVKDSDGYLGSHVVSTYKEILKHKKCGHSVESGICGYYHCEKCRSLVHRDACEWVKEYVS